MFYISIHALLAESDNLHPGYCAFIHSFLSTLSLRRATGFCDLEPIRNAISIHALLAESDLEILLPCLVIHNFYPRSPCGERPLILADTMLHTEFLSTLSLRRATTLVLDIL